MKKKPWTYGASSSWRARSRPDLQSGTPGFCGSGAFLLTPGTLYLSHFAGPAGAAAVLSAAEGADAASIMANADATGRTTREKIVKANPFLARFTAANLKNWSDRKIDAEPTDGARRKPTINAVRLAARQQPN